MRENVSRPRRSRRQTVPTMVPAQDRPGGIGEAGVRSAAMDARHDPGADLATRRAESIEDAAAEPIRVRGGGWVRVGTASWTDPTMTASGVVQPAVADSAEDRLHLYAEKC